MLAWDVSSDVSVTQWLHSSPQHGLHSVHARGYCKCMMCPQTSVCLLWFVYNFDIVIITFSRHWLKPNTAQLLFTSLVDGLCSLATVFSWPFALNKRKAKGPSPSPWGNMEEDKANPLPNLLCCQNENGDSHTDLRILYKGTFHCFFFFHGCHFRWFLLWKAAVTHWLRS